MIDGIDSVAEIRRVEREHSKDHDGGYAAVAAIRELWHKLGPNGKESFKNTLVGLVLEREPAIWSLAWEALIQERIMDIGSTMLTALSVRESDVEWSDDIVMGLLRLGYRDGLEYLRAYVHSRLTQVGPFALPLTAALARISPEDSVQIAADYMVKAKQDNSLMRVEKYTPAFVRHYVAVDDHLLQRLVTEIKRRDADLAKTIGANLTSQILKPWILDELGPERSESIRVGIASASVN